MTDFLGLLDEEIGRVSAHLDALRATRAFYANQARDEAPSQTGKTPIQASLQTAGEPLRIIGRPDPTPAPQPTEPVRTRGSAASKTKKVTKKASTRADVMRKRAMMQEITALITRRNEPVPTKEILNHLTNLGFTIGGRHPTSSLSAALSTDARFSTDRGGWSLTDAQQAATASQPERMAS